MTTRPIILVDMDGPLAGFEEGFLDRWQSEFPNRPFVALEDRRGFEIELQYPEEFHDDIWRIMDEENFFVSLPPVEGAVEAINTLQNQYGEVWFCTSPMSSNPRCAYEKILWIEKTLGVDANGNDWHRKMIITKDKTMVRGDYLIDDKVDITGLMVPVWQHIVYPTHSNTDQDHGERERADWVGITEYFERMKLREVAEATV